MTRSIWKGPFIDNCLFRSQIRISSEQKKQLKIWSRRSTIIPQFIGQKVLIYNGKNWLNVLITEEMIGHKFGEFASTRRTTSKIQQRRNIKTKKIH